MSGTFNLLNFNNISIEMMCLGSGVFEIGQRVCPMNNGPTKKTICYAGVMRSRTTHWHKGQRG